MQLVSGLLGQFRGTNMADAQDQVCCLKPSEFQGEPGTAVVGRLVIKRDQTIKPKAGARPKGAKAGKGIPADTYKLELHLCGGPSIGEVLYAEAWGESAKAFFSRFERGQILSIQGAEVVNAPPKFSTSRLPYFLKLKAPFSVRTIVKVVEDNVWSTLPDRHPLQPLKALVRVEHRQQVCVSVKVVQHQEPVPRGTAQGSVLVCNSMVQQGTTQIRCAFWRDHASALGAYQEGDWVLMLQVMAKQRDGGWELVANDATTLESCPADLVEQLIAEEAEGGGTLTCITQSRSKDWERCSATPATLSALVGTIVPGLPRKFSDVYFLHGLQVMGVSSVRQESDAWFMEACETCKRSAPCATHPEAPTSKRWLLKVLLADACTQHDFVLYHDVMTKALPDLAGRLAANVSGDDLLRPYKREILDELRSQPWSIKVTFRENEYTQVNELECRFLIPTIDRAGEVLQCVPKSPLPVHGLGNGCPIAQLSETSYDNDLGLVKAGDFCGMSVRIFVKISEQDCPDDEACVQDPGSAGLRVKRMVHCALSSQEETWQITIAGPPSVVNPINRARAGDCFFVVAMMTSNNKTFQVNWFAKIPESCRDSLLGFMKQQLTLQKGVHVAFGEKMTPTKRLKVIGDESGAIEADATAIRIPFRS